MFIQWIYANLKTYKIYCNANKYFLLVAISRTKTVKFGDTDISIQSAFRMNISLKCTIGSLKYEHLLRLSLSIYDHD